MIDHGYSRRTMLSLGGVVLLAGCQVIPKGPPPEAPLPPAPAPSGSTLPPDQQRHRVALLVPTSGSNAAVGQALANAANMALLDTNADNLRITTYDTATGPADAAARALADGNRLILGPLLGEDVGVVNRIARAKGVPLIAFSNDAGVAARDAFIMGSLPSQSIERTIAFARAKGLSRFSALVPDGEYGLRAAAAFDTAVREAGGTVIGVENYARGNTSIVSAAQRLKSRGNADAVLIADSGRFAVQAAPQLKSAGAARPQLLGTELWSGDAAVARSASLRGSWYAAVSDQRWAQFASSYRTRFGAQPFRIATLGYDSVLLTLRVARGGWKPGAVFPTGKLSDSGGFLGLDGAFRFRAGGMVERAFEVNEIRASGPVVVSPAPAKFAD